MKFKSLSLLFLLFLFLSALLAAQTPFDRSGRPGLPPHGTQLPASCQPPDIYFLDAANGANSAGFYACPVDSWVCMSCGGASSGLGDPGLDSIPYRNAPGLTRPATSSDVRALWSGTCDITTYLRGDGVCAVDETRDIIVDVTQSPFGAKGDQRANAFGQFTIGSAIVTIGGGVQQPKFAIGRDEGKAISITNIEMSLAPQLAGSVVANGASCIASPGTLGSSTLDSYVYYTLSYKNPTSGLYSPPSHEGFNRIPAGTTAACIKGTTPVAIPSGYPTGYTQYCVWSVGETINTITPPGFASGKQYTQNSLLGCVNIGTDFEIDALPSGSSPGNPPNRVIPTFTGTIVSVQSTTQATVSSNISTTAGTCTNSNTVCQYVSWGTDDSTAVAAAVTYISTSGKRGGTLFFPGQSQLDSNRTGSYLLNTTVSIPGPQSVNTMFRVQGAGGIGAFSITGTNGVNPIATSQLVSFTPGPIMTIGTNDQNSAANAGPTIQDIGFKDASGACVVRGGLLMYAMTRAKIQNVSGGDFCNDQIETLNSNMQVHGGYMLRFDAACTTPGTGGCDANVPFNNFNYIDTLHCLNCQNPFQAVNGKQSAFKIRDSEFHSTNMGGGIGYGFISGITSAANTSGGGNNLVDGTQMAYYPIGIYANDEVGNDLNMNHMESTIGGTEPNISGSAKFGTLIWLDSTPGKTFCQGTDIHDSTTSKLSLGVFISLGCSQTLITGYSQDTATVTSIHDEGAGTVMYMTAPGSSFGGSICAGGCNYTPVIRSTTFVAGDLACYASGSNTVGSCPSAAQNANNVGIICCGTDTNTFGLSPNMGGYIQTSGVGVINFFSSSSAAVGDHICYDPGNGGKMVNNGTVLCTGGTQIGRVRVAVTNQLNAIVQLSNNAFLGGAGGGAQISGAPSNHQIAMWVSGSAIKGVTINNNSILLGVTGADPVNMVIPACGDGTHALGFLANVLVCQTLTGGGGPGTVTNFSSGNLPPLFTTNVATPTTTPALTFVLSNFAPRTFLGNSSGSSAPPTAVAISAADLPGTITSSTSGNAATSSAFDHNPTNCGVGNYPLGVDATGAAESCTAIPGGGNVSNSGSPLAQQVAIWLDSTHIKGVTGFTSTDSGDVGVNSLTITGGSGPDLWANQSTPAGSPNSDPNCTGGDCLYTFGSATDQRFHDKNNAGTVGTTVVPDTGATNNFLTGIGPNGAITKAQPLISNLSTFSSSSFFAKVTDPTGSGLLMGNISPQITTPIIADFTTSQHNHQNAAGGGTLTEAALNLSDITTNNASITKHGFVPKYPNDATKFLDGTGAYTAPGAPTTLNSNVTFCDVTDPTKCVKFVMSGITTGTTRSWTWGNFNGTVVDTSNTQTLSLKTLITPTIADLTNATHSHQNAAGGGTLDAAAIAAGTLAVARGGTNLTAAADDSMMLGNGTTWQSKALPSCTDTVGQHLNYDASTNTFSCGTSAVLPVTRSLVFTFGSPEGSALSTGIVRYITVPFGCTINGYSLKADAGTFTVKFWKIASGTALPTVSNVISTSGLALSSGTLLISSTTSDFTTTTVTANDTVAATITAVATAKYVQAQVGCVQ